LFGKTDVKPVNIETLISTWLVL